MCQNIGQSRDGRSKACWHKDVYVEVNVELSNQVEESYQPMKIYAKKTHLIYKHWVITNILSMNLLIGILPQ